MQLGNSSLQQQLIAALQPAQQTPVQQQQHQTSTTQNIIVHQLPAAQPQPQPTQLSVPQQIIITAQPPPQPAPQPQLQQQQPAQINLQQLQQVTCLLQWSVRQFTVLYCTLANTNKRRYRFFAKLLWSFLKFLVWCFPEACHSVAESQQVAKKYFWLSFHWLFCGLVIAGTYDQLTRYVFAWFQLYCTLVL